MNLGMKRLLSMLMALMMVFSMITPVSASATGNTKHNKTVEIEVAESTKLKVPGVYARITWESSDDGIAKVSSNGTVTGVASGTATITATYRIHFGFWGRNKTTTFTVVVTEPETQDVTVEEGKTLQLSVNAKGGKVAWSSSNSNVATVNKNGQLRGIAPGTATVTAKISRSHGFFGKKTETVYFKVTVTEAPQEEAPEEPEVLTVKEGETLQLTVDAKGGKVTWKSSNKRIATVDGRGLVKGIRQGKVTITATVTKTASHRFPWQRPGRPTTEVIKFEVTVLPEAPAINYFTVTFNSNGGSEVAAQTIEEGMTVVEPEEPILDGYTFMGWYADEELTEEYVFAAPVTGDITLYAKWEDINAVYTVTFETNGGSAVTAQTIHSGESAFRPANPVKQGYVFENWYIDEGLTDVYDFDLCVFEDITLYANWTDLSVQISLNAGDYANGVVNRVVTGSVTSNSTITSITYQLTSSENTTSGQISLQNAAAFEIQAMLKNGNNTLTVYVKTEDGTVSSASVTMVYDSGHVYDSGEVYDQFDDRLIKTPLDEDEEGNPSTYLVANILSLYFYDFVSYEEREAFITETLGGEVAGYLNSLDMMQILLPNPVPKAAEIGYTGETDLTRISEDEIWEYADALAAAYSDILESADPEFIHMDMTLTITTNDPWGNGANDDWWLETIEAYDTWEYDDHYNSDYFTNINLGVVDSGFKTSHEELNGNIDVISWTDSVDSHGTHVSGIIGAEANNRRGIAGVTYNNGYLYAYDVENFLGISDSAIESGLTKAVESGAKVINFSLGQSGSIKSGSFNLKASTIKSEGKSWSKTMGKLLAKGNDFIVVQSAGNGNRDKIGVNYWNNGLFSSINSSNCYSSDGGWFSNPVSKQQIMDRILIVAATDSSNRMTYFSNGGSGELNIIAAPGDMIYSTNCGNNSDYIYMSGTSMAAPIVTGVCGLVWSVNTRLYGDEVVDLVMGNTEGIASTNSSSQTTGGMGIINALKAVEAAIETLPYSYGNVIDAVTSAVIDSANITIYNSDGEIVGEEQTYHTDSNGNFTLPNLPYGTYRVQISADGYVTATKTLNVNKTSNINLGTVGLTPVTSGNIYTITLEWLGEPSDLDSHLVATTVDGEPYHVYYSNRNPSPAYADLDRDDVDYEGPETITIRDITKLRNIRYAVHDYTNRGSTDSKVMSNSGATIVVAKDGVEIYKTSVPVNRDGTEWDVFAIDASGNIIPMDQMKYCSSPGAVLGAGGYSFGFGRGDDELKDYEKEIPETTEETVPETTEETVPETTEETIPETTEETVPETTEETIPETTEETVPETTEETVPETTEETDPETTEEIALTDTSEEETASKELGQPDDSEESDIPKEISIIPEDTSDEDESPENEASEETETE